MTFKEACAGVVSRCRAARIGCARRSSFSSFREALYLTGLAACGSGPPGGPARLCMSNRFIFVPFCMITSPGFWSAAQRPAHKETHL
jgi:hypothetical protein